MPVLWELEPATAAKHQLYRRYLDAWWPILVQPSSRDGHVRPRVTYLDAFAGPGRYVGGQEGSPVFALHRLLDHAAVDRTNLTVNGSVCCSWRKVAGGMSICWASLTAISAISTSFPSGP